MPSVVENKDASTSTLYDRSCNKRKLYDNLVSDIKKFCSPQLIKNDCNINLICADIDSCLIHGLKPDLLNNSFELLKKISKDCEQAQYIVNICEKSSLACSSSTETTNIENEKIRNSLTQQEELFIPSRTVPLWLKVALIEKKIVTIIEEINKKASEYYSNHALMLDSGYFLNISQQLAYSCGNSTTTSCNCLSSVIKHPNTLKELKDHASATLIDNMLVSQNDQEFYKTLKHFVAVLTYDEAEASFNFNKGAIDDLSEYKIITPNSLCGLNLRISETVAQDLKVYLAKPRQIKKFFGFVLRPAIDEHGNKLENLRRGDILKMHHKVPISEINRLFKEKIVSMKAEKIKKMYEDYINNSRNIETRQYTINEIFSQRNNYQNCLGVLAKSVGWNLNNLVYGPGKRLDPGSEIDFDLLSSFDKEEVSYGGVLLKRYHIPDITDRLTQMGETPGKIKTWHFDNKKSLYYCQESPINGIRYSPFKFDEFDMNMNNGLGYYQQSISDFAQLHTGNYYK